MKMPNLLNTVIDDSNFQQYLAHPGVASGLVPRDFQAYPQGYLGPIAEPFNLPLIPESDWDARIAEQEEQKSSLQHIYDTGNNGQPIPSLDQNGQGYCWFYSTTCAVQAMEAVQRKPYVKLSAHMGACIIKNYRDEGGWNSLSLKFATEHGIASCATWPEKSMAKTNDTPAMRADAKKHLVQEWWDLSDSPQTAKGQLATLLLLNVPVMVDFNWWGHSVCAMRLVKRSPFTIRIKNSWTDTWGDRGWGDLVDSKALPNGAGAPRVIVA